MWVVTDCHQFLSMEFENNRIVFYPVKERIVEVVLNDIYGTRIQIPKDISQDFSFRYDIYKQETCKYLQNNLRIISAGGATSKLGKFLRINFYIETTEYRISDIQYINS